MALEWLMNSSSNVIGLDMRTFVPIILSPVELVLYSVSSAAGGNTYAEPARNDGVWTAQYLSNPTLAIFLKFIIEKLAKNRNKVLK